MGCHGKGSLKPGILSFKAPWEAHAKGYGEAIGCGCPEGLQGTGRSRGKCGPFAAVGRPQPWAARICGPFAGAGGSHWRVVRICGGLANESGSQLIVVRKREWFLSRCTFDFKNDKKSVA